MEQTKPLTPKEEEELIKNCDAIVWASYQQEEEVHTRMTFFSLPSKTKPTEMGFRYNILMFRTPFDEDLGMFKAILGDPKGYVERVGRLGYHGMMFKEKIKLKVEFKELITRMLTNWGFTEPQIKKAIKIEK